MNGIVGQIEVMGSREKGKTLIFSRITYGGAGATCPKYIYRGCVACGPCFCHLLLMPLLALLEIKHCPVPGRSVGSMAAPSGACQGVSLWSLKLIGYWIFA